MIKQLVLMCIAFFLHRSVLEFLRPKTLQADSIGRNKPGFLDTRVSSTYAVGTETGIVVTDCLRNSPLPCGYLANFISQAAMLYIEQCDMWESKTTDLGTKKKFCNNSSQKFRASLYKHIIDNLDLFNNVLKEFLQQKYEHISIKTLKSSSRVLAVHLRTDSGSNSNVNVYQLGDSLITRFELVKSSHGGLFFSPVFNGSPLKPDDKLEAFVVPEKRSKRYDFGTDKSLKVDRNNLILVSTSGLHDTLFLSVITLCVNYLIMAQQEHYLGHKTVNMDPKTILEPVKDALSAFFEKQRAFKKVIGSLTDHKEKIMKDFKNDEIKGSAPSKKLQIISKLREMYLEETFRPNLTRVERDKQNSNNNQLFNPHESAKSIFDDDLLTSELGERDFDLGYQDTRHIGNKNASKQPLSLAEKKKTMSMHSINLAIETAGLGLDEDDVDDILKEDQEFCKRKHEAKKSMFKSRSNATLTANKFTSVDKNGVKNKNMGVFQQPKKSVDNTNNQMKTSIQRTSGLQKPSMITTGRKSVMGTPNKINTQLKTGSFQNATKKTSISEAFPKNMLVNNKGETNGTKQSSVTFNSKPQKQKPLTKLSQVFGKCTTEDLIFDYFNNGQLSDCVAEALKSMFSFSEYTDDFYDEFVDSAFIGEALSHFAMSLYEVEKNNVYPQMLDAFFNEAMKDDSKNALFKKPDSISTAVGFIVDKDRKLKQDLEAVYNGIENTIDEDLDRDLEGFLKNIQQSK